MLVNTNPHARFRVSMTIELRIKWGGIFAFFYGGQNGIFASLLV